MSSTLENVSDNVFKNVVLWAKESIVRSALILILFTVVGVPLIQYLQNVVRTFPYSQLFQQFQNYIAGNFSGSELFILVLIITLFILVMAIFSKQISANVFIENFNKELSEWSIPLNSTWTTQRCGDAFGKALKVINSEYPGTAKPLYGWYDYKISFWSKIVKEENNKSKIGIVIRSENNLNGLVLEFSNDYFFPGFLHNGTYISDDVNNKKLPSDISYNEWVKIQIRVKGNNILIDIGGYEMHYSIPTYSLVVKSIDLLSIFNSSIKISDLNKSAQEVSEKQQESNRLWEKYHKETDQEKKKLARTEWYEFTDKKMPQTTNLQFEYQRGSVGLLGKNKTPSFYRNLTIKKI